jgi:hypothetical protein
MGNSMLTDATKDAMIARLTKKAHELRALLGTEHANIHVMGLALDHLDIAIFLAIHAIRQDDWTAHSSLEE